MKMREVAYFLQRLASPECVEPNGKTILENSLITISTESGDGRHDDVKRELSGSSTPSRAPAAASRAVSSSMSGPSDRRVQHMLAAMGVSRRMGPSNRESRTVDALRA